MAQALGTGTELRACRARGFEVAGASCQGARRPLNEDRFRLGREGFCLMDGVGGGEAGEVFAELAANRVQRLIERGADPAEALREAGDDLRALRGEVLHAFGGAMGCACSFGGDGGCVIALLGDVRAFLVGKEGIEEVCQAPLRGGRYLGDGGLGRPRARRIAPACLASRVLLVCSDGLWRYVSVREVAETVLGMPSLDAAAERLVALARQCASPDDVTVTLCRPFAESGRCMTCRRPTVG